MKTLTDRLIAPDMARIDAQNARRHVLALTLSKLADGLLDPKLVLSWLAGAIGVPAVFIGMLVPIREAGALLPQLVIGARLRAKRQRRWVWIAGSAVQGLAAFGIAAAAVMTGGIVAGLMICGLLAVLSVARAACSTSHKDILGKTVVKTRRGAVTGLAGSVSAAGVAVFAVLMLAGVLTSQAALVGAVALAGLAWLLAALTLIGLREEDSTPQTGSSTAAYRTILGRNANLRRFILVRGLLVSSALAPSYLVLLSVREGGTLAALGALVLASSVAGFVSSYIWGRLSDRDSRLVLALCGGLAGVAILAAIAAQILGVAQVPGVIPAALLVLMLAYHGVRQARSIYLVDMSAAEDRAQNTAIANTAIGVILLLAGLFGGALSFIGPLGALGGFAAMSLAGGVSALTLQRPAG